MSSTATASREHLRARLSKYFGAHGRFCASHPWEVIVTTVTLTVCALSMSVLSGGKVGVCGISKPCENKPVTKTEQSDAVMLIVNCLAVIYIYNQFSRLRKAGSKYLLGIAGLFTIFSSFVFGTTVVNLIDNKVSGLNEALPFFLLLIDLSKASALAKFAFRSKSKEEVRDNIGHGMAVLGPTMTLDTLVEVLLIGIGTISGVPQLYTTCCFGCMSIIANYIVFMTFFPASLALVLEVCPYDPGNPSWQLDDLARDMHNVDQREPNPVVQRVKIIMAMGLVAVHLHSRFLSGMTGLSFGFSPHSSEDGETALEQSEVGDEEIEKVPLPDYLWWKVFNLSVDQLVAILLAVILFVKYIFFDKSETFATSVPPTPTHSRHNSTTYGSKPSLKYAKPQTPRSVSCPYSLSNPSSSSTIQRRRTGATSNQDPILTTGIKGLNTVPNGIEKVVNGGIVIPGGSEIMGIKPVKQEKRALQDVPKLSPPEVTETTDAGNLGGGGLVRSRSKKNFLEEKVAPPLMPKTSVHVGVQVDTLPPPSVGAKFTIGSGRRDSVLEPESDVASSGNVTPDSQELEPPSEPRPVEQCLVIFKSDGGAAQLSDQEIIQLVKAKHIPAYKLETALGDHERGVSIRRQMIGKNFPSDVLKTLPFTNYDYTLVNGACCENVIGYMPIPVGYAGPLILDEKPYYVPMSTTEGALVASTNRGCRAVASSGGVKSSVLDDGMTRGPVARLPSATEAGAVKVWLDDAENFALVEEKFNSTSRFAKLKSVHTAIAGRLIYIRFKAVSGDAMGMNMLSKGVEKCMQFLQIQFPSMELISLSGNFCTDKKPAAINWLEGRGKSIVCEATIPAQVVKQVLKTSVDALVELNISKNLVGSAMAGALGGFNAHAANIVTAIYIATGQDPAQNIASSNCMTLMERSGPRGEDLYITCTMPSIEIGTVGGGTILAPQSACLSMLGVKGPHMENPGRNATQLARVVCATVLAGELSLLSALAAGHLVRSHLTHNRSQLNLASIPEASSSSDVKEHRRTHSDTTPRDTGPAHSRLDSRRASTQI